MVTKPKWWQTRYTLFTIICVIMSFAFVPLMQLAYSYNLVQIFNQQILLALLGVEATITGFYGLIFVNGLASFRGTFEMLQNGWDRNSAKSERARENKANISEDNYLEVTKECSAFSNGWIKAVLAANSNKINFVNRSIVTGVSLVVSIFAVLMSLAVNSMQATFFLSYLSFEILVFISLPQIFWAIRDLGRDAYQDWSKGCL